jgi:hypothetical protein
VVCDDNSRLLHGYLDGELNLGRSLEIEEHLQACPDCAQQLWSEQTLREAFRSSSLYERAPSGAHYHAEGKAPGMELAGCRGSDHADGTVNVADNPRNRKPRQIRLGGSGTHRQSHSFASVRSSVRRAIDRSAHRQAVVRWQARFLATRPRLNKRRVPTNRWPPHHRAVAALVYQRHQHLINVFIWPADTQTDSNLHSESSQGYNMVFWERGGMYLCAISDLSTNEFQQFAQLLEK